MLKQKASDERLTIKLSFSIYFPCFITLYKFVPDKASREFYMSFVGAVNITSEMFVETLSCIT